VKSTVTSADRPSPNPSEIPRADWDRAPWNRWTFQHVADMVATVPVSRGDGPASRLGSALQDIDGIAFECDGRRDTIGGFLESSFTDGFLVLHRGHVVAERYFNEMEPATLHLSQSVAKSIVGTVAGILIGRGELDPSAPLTLYVPEFEATAYRGASVQHVLDMTSGVVFDETYTALDSHMAKLDVAAGWKDSPDPAWPRTVWDLVLTLKDASRPHGAQFEYRSIETDVLAFAMQRATARALPELVSRELWQKIGAEADACFTVDPSGYALADGGFNATLRDYARFALLHLGRGTIDGRRIVPEAWHQEIRRGDHARFHGDVRAALPRGAYHNQFWIEDPAGSSYMARGVFGQLIYIDPAAEFAAVKLSSWPDFTNLARTRTALAAIRAIRDSLAASHAPA
jgi:CubicO group peptidase (beta-lactamase class C family)